MNNQNPTLSQIIKILNDGRYHDLNMIASKLGTTESAVWESLKKLESYGIELTSMKTMGYRLLDPIHLLDKDYILANLNHPKFSLDLFETINSTNQYLKELPVTKGPSFCLAELQTLGRGRLGRSWHSPFGQNIYLSCRYLYQKDLSDLAGLSLVVALALISTLKKFLPSDQIKIKWPNDIVFDGKKLAGIIIDIETTADGLNYAIIGIGLNVNMLLDKDNQITQAWSSMRKIAGDSFDRNKICVLLIETLLKYLKRFATVDLLDFAQEWQQVDYLLGKKINIETAEEKIVGIAKGIDRSGRILLETSDGELKNFSSGDVSISTY